MKKPQREKSKLQTFREEYLVSYDRRKQDGYWQKVEESVFVDVEDKLIASLRGV